VPRIKKFETEYENQITSINERGVVVRLYSQNMSDLTEEGEFHTHSKRGYRIWMDNEYVILTPKEIKELKKMWDKKTCKTKVSSKKTMKCS
jgi:hypothetical protein